MSDTDEPPATPDGERPEQPDAGGHHSPSLRDLNEKIASVRRDKEAAIEAHDFARADRLREFEKHLLAWKSEQATHRPDPDEHPPRTDAAIRGTATDDIDHNSRVGAGVVLGGGAVIVLATLLPWVSVSTVMGTQTAAGTDGPDGQHVLLTGAAIAAMGLARLVRKHEPSWAQIFPMLGALWAGYIGWWHIQFAQNKFAEYTSQYPQLAGGYVRPSIGIGLYLILIGAAATLVGASTQGKVDRESLPPLPPISYYTGMDRFFGFTRMQADRIAGKLNIDTRHSYSPEFFRELRERLGGRTLEED